MKKKKKVTDECTEIIGYFGNLCSTLFIKIKVQKAYLKKGKIKVQKLIRRAGACIRGIPLQGSFFSILIFVKTFLHSSKNSRNFMVFKL